MHVHAGTKPFGLSNARYGLTFFHFTWNLQPAESSLIFSRRNRVTFFQDHPEISRDRESLLPENLGRSEDRIHFSKNPLLVIFPSSKIIYESPVNSFFFSRPIFLRKHRVEQSVQRVCFDRFFSLLIPWRTRLLWSWDRRRRMKDA